MKMIRHQSKDILFGTEKSIKIGDQLCIPLKSFGEFTATAQQITETGVIFLFDELIVERQMNNMNINEGGFKASDLNEWLQNVLFLEFPEELRKRIKNLEIPSYGQIFGHDNWYNVMEPDEDEQWKLMKKRKNRIAYFNGNRYWWWLKNDTNKEFSSSYFASVTTYGYAAYVSASDSNGVRPDFLFVR